MNIPEKAAPEIVQTVLNHGAAAYVVKSVNPIDLSSALRQALEGTVFSAVGLPEQTAQQDAVKAAGLTDPLDAPARARWPLDESAEKIETGLAFAILKAGIDGRSDQRVIGYQLMVISTG